MDISQEFLIDMAVNMGGYVLAGLISVLVYALLHRRRRSAAPDVNPVEVHEHESEPQPASEKVNRRLEFIKLGERPDAAANEDSLESAPNTVATGDRRNRAEIIRIARTMLKAGASDEKIKRLIPISDAELSLLSMSKS